MLYVIIGDSKLQTNSVECTISRFQLGQITYYNIIYKNNFIIFISKENYNLAQTN